MENQKVVLITGASSGIGKETAKMLAEKGYKVYGAARRTERMEDLKKYGIIPVSLDVTNQKSIADTINKILSEEKTIDILINNAGYGSFGALEDIPIEEAKRQFEVNIFGLAELIKQVLPSMRKQHNGKIINVSSMAAYFGEPNGSWYHASKAALDRLSDCLRMEVKSFGIKVVLIQPGMIETEWSKIAGENLLKTSANSVYASMANKQAEQMPKMYRLASKPEVVAKTICKACLKKNPKTRYKTGGYAKQMVFLAHLLPDKWFDAIMLKALN